MFETGLSRGEEKGRRGDTHIVAVEVERGQQLARDVVIWPAGERRTVGLTRGGASDLSRNRTR